MSQNHEHFWVIRWKRRWKIYFTFVACLLDYSIKNWRWILGHIDTIFEEVSVCKLHVVNNLKYNNFIYPEKYRSLLLFLNNTCTTEIYLNQKCNGGFRKVNLNIPFSLLYLLLKSSALNLFSLTNTNIEVAFQIKFTICSYLQLKCYIVNH